VSCAWHASASSTDRFDDATTFHPLIACVQTGSRDVVTHVVRMGTILFAFSSQLNPGATTVLGDEIGAHLTKHGDGVKDVAFAVADCRAMFEAAVKRGATSVVEPTESSDEFGSVVTATIRTYGDTLHSFVQRGSYSGPFLPGYRAVTGPADPLLAITPAIGLERIDHIVGNMPDKGMLPTVEWYERVMQFHRFWSVDDSQIHTEYSSLRSVVMADYDEVVKMPINEPAKGLRKSQIQEYVDYYAGSGVQHIALATHDILHAITHLRARGVEFLRVPDTYYEALRARLAAGGVAVKEDLAEVQRLNILVDFDDRGYLLQLFTKPLQDRPTVFLEVIQREGVRGTAPEGERCAVAGGASAGCSDGAMPDPCAAAAVFTLSCLFAPLHYPCLCCSATASALATSSPCLSPSSASRHCGAT
jgi:4-hydroxyphenylpyruvate dioxygenase